MDDLEKTLEQFQQELAEEENEQLDALLEEFLNEPTPAFEEPDSTVAADAPVEYRNFSNDYGAKLPEDAEEQSAEETPEQLRKRQQDERVILGLMIFASVECVGILAILAYWLKMFL